MNKKNIRTKYIKSLIDDKEELSNILKESTKDSIKSLIDESVNQNLREMLAEADEKYEEEEVETPDEDITKIETSKEETDNNEEENEETSNETEKEEEQTIDNADEFEEVWKEFSDDQNEDGEYDLRGKDMDTLLKVLQAMTPEDSINIDKNSDGTVTLTQDGEEEGDTENSEITINVEDNNDDDNPSDEEDDDLDLDGFNFDDIDNESDDDNNDEEDEEGEITFEIEPDEDENDDEVLNEQEMDLGYTTTYQKDTAVTMPKDRDVEITIEDGIPRGAENDTRRYGKPQDPSTSKPYTRPVNSQKANPCEKDLVNVYKESDELTNKVKKILAQANALIKENKELKKIASQIKEKLNESVVINSSLAKVIKLITENSTTKDEKIGMIQRFNKVKNLNECESLYEAISLELKNANSVNKGKLLDQQLTENKTQKTDLIVETNMLNQSKDLQQILSLQKRLDNI